MYSRRAESDFSRAEGEKNSSSSRAERRKLAFLACFAGTRFIGEQQLNAVNIVVPSPVTTRSESESESESIILKSESKYESDKTQACVSKSLSPYENHGILRASVLQGRQTRH